MREHQNLKPYNWFNVKLYTLMMLFYKDVFVGDFFAQRIPQDREILEIGSGTGYDFKTFLKSYRVTGSDYSDHFLKGLNKKFKGHNFLKLNALTLETDRDFDVIYSNKVLHHLSPEQLASSFQAQDRVLRKGGLLFHTFWKGRKMEGKAGGLPDFRYEKEDILEMSGHFVLEDYAEYSELSPNDSFVILLRKPS